jgi:hypothetical protein
MTLALDVVASLVGSSPGKDKSVDRATARDLQAEAALLRKYSAELRANSNEVRKQVELILKKHTNPPHRTTQDHGFLLPRPEA